MVICLSDAVARTIEEAGGSYYGRDGRSLGVADGLIHISTGVHKAGIQRAVAL